MSQKWISYWVIIWVFLITIVLGAIFLKNVVENYDFWNEEISNVHPLMKNEMQFYWQNNWFDSFRENNHITFNNSGYQWNTSFNKSHRIFGALKINIQNNTIISGEENLPE